MLSTISAKLDQSIPPNRFNSFTETNSAPEFSRMDPPMASLAYQPFVQQKETLSSTGLSNFAPFMQLSHPLASAATSTAFHLQPTPSAFAPSSASQKEQTPVSNPHALPSYAPSTNFLPPRSTDHFITSTTMFTGDSNKDEDVLARVLSRLQESGHRVSSHK